VPSEQDKKASIAVPDGFEPFEEPNSFMGHVGPMFWRRLETHTEFYFRAEQHQVNPVGVVHGGMLATIADVCLGSTAGVVLGHEGVYPTVTLNLTFVNAARLGDEVFGRAQVERLTKTLAFVTGALSVKGEPVVLATGVYRNPPQPKS
jgi:acyl-coenzyme A thioesterase 13